MLRTSLLNHLDILYKDYLAYEGYKLKFNPDLPFTTQVEAFETLKIYYEKAQFELVSDMDIVAKAGAGEVIAWVGEVCYYTSNFLELEPWLQLAHTLVEIMNMHNYYDMGARNISPLYSKLIDPVLQFNQYMVTMYRNYFDLFLCVNLYKFLDKTPSVTQVGIDLGFQLPKLTEEKTRLYLKRVLAGDAFLGKVEYILEVDDLVLCNLELNQLHLSEKKLWVHPVNYKEICIDKKKGEVLKSKTPSYTRLKKQYALMKKIGNK